MRALIPLSAVALGLMVVSTARADVLISSESITAADGKTSTADMYFAADRLKMDMDKTEVIYRDDTGTIYNVMKDQHQYVALDPATQQRMAATMSAMQEQMRQRMQSMPEAQRKQMEASGVGAAMQPKPTSPYVKTDQSKTVGAWPCQVFRKTLGGGMTVDSCFATLSTIGITRNDLAVVKKLMERMQKAMPMAGAMNSMDFDKQTQEIGFEGFPVETVTSVNGAPHTTSTVKSVQHLSLPAETFELPAGYTKQEVPGFGK
jgi:hypothetical protein